MLTVLRVFRLTDPPWGILYHFHAPVYAFDSMYPGFLFLSKRSQAGLRCTEKLFFTCDWVLYRLEIAKNVI